MTTKQPISLPRLLLLSGCLLLQSANCQRQANPRQAAAAASAVTWTPSSPYRPHNQQQLYPSNNVQANTYRPLQPAAQLALQSQLQQRAPLASSPLQQRARQQAEVVEYYDDEEYYDDAADEAAPQQPAAKQLEPSYASSDAAVKGSRDARERGDDKQQQQATKASGEGVNSTAYDDAYYYDDDYEEIEQQPEKGVNGSVESEEGDKPKPVASSSTTAAAPSSTPTTPPPSTTSKRPVESTTITTTTTTTSSSTAISSPQEKATQKATVEDDESDGSSILIGEAIVSVVTTKSVVNGTYSVPDSTTLLPSTASVDEVQRQEEEEEKKDEDAEAMVKDEGVESEEQVEDVDDEVAESDKSSTTTTFAPSSSTSTSSPTTAEASTEPSPPSSTTIQASVQTGRSVSGARFLPFPSVVDGKAASGDSDKSSSSNPPAEQLDSTESIIDKLDRVQSELSNGFLAGNNGRFVPRRYNKKPFSVTSLALPPTTTVAPTSSPIAPITITTITKRPRIQTTLDDVAAFLPKDFPKASYRTTTLPPVTLTKRPKLQTTLDDVEAFLPKDFSRPGHRASTPGTKRPKYQTTLDDVESFLPKDFPKFRSGYKRPGGYKTSTTSSSSTATTERSTGSTRKKTLSTIEDIASFLPPGYKLRKEDATTEKSVTLSEALAKTKLGKNASAGVASTTPSGLDEPAKTIEQLLAKPAAVDISALLPPGYKLDASSEKPSTTSKPKGGDIVPIEKLLTKSSVDLSALLPPGYKPPADEKASDPLQELLSKSQVDVSAFLPPGFAAADSEDDAQQQQQQESSTAKNKLVFPSRPGGGTRKPIHKVTTQSSRSNGGTIEASSPKIQKGWPTRATTEFTGWPTSSTTPISISKLIETARTATVSSANASVVPTTSGELSSTTSTTTTTTTTIRPTTPGLCDVECEVAGTIRIVENARWAPELLDRNTREWQDLAEEIEREMNLVFAKSPILVKWFRNIRIDSFSPGSVLVDYFVELKELKQKINTQQLKVIFHDSLKTFNYDDPMEAMPKGPMKLGKFTIDPKATDFVVIPRVASPKMLEDENRLFPQWAIAVIVIGVGGLLFIIVFGVSVLVNRQNGAKLKPSMTTPMYDEEVSKTGMSHAVSVTPPSRPPSDYQKYDPHAAWNDSGWHDKTFESSSHKILVDGLPYQRKYNPYDSWKSEWNGYATNYGYYPQTHAGGSNFSRHHPDYDF